MNKMKSMLFLMVSFMILFSFSGCGASKYALPSTSTVKQIINSEKFAYVIFGTEEIGASRSNPIFEYFPETETFKLVTILGSNQKYIYPIEEGIHYFYSMGGETYDFLKVEASKGKKYFTHIETVFWSWRMTTPIVFEPTTDKELIEKINTKMLIENSEQSQKWYEARKDNSKFKAKVKVRFEDWKEENEKEKTLHVEDGFPIK